MRTLILPLALLSTACGDDAAGPGGLSEGEARELDEAAAIVDSQRIEAEDMPSDLRPEPGPDESSD